MNNNKQFVIVSHFRGYAVMERGGHFKPLKVTGDIRLAREYVKKLTTKKKYLRR